MLDLDGNRLCESIVCILFKFCGCFCLFCIIMFQQLKMGKLKEYGDVVIVGGIFTYSCVFIE